MNWRYVLPAVFVIGLMVMLAIGLTLDPRKVPSPLIDKPAPAFSLPSLHQPDQLVSQQSLRGQVHLLNVWASWCVACREEHEQIKQLATTYNIPIIGLNYKDERSDAIQWLERFGDPYQLIAVDYQGNVGIDWGVYGVPETFLIDQAGVIRYKHIGPIKPADIPQTILPLLRKLGATGVMQ
ncbi:MAG: DsbE family thiol:disulfide interchange protein [Nevskiales bacterium]